MQHIQATNLSNKNTKLAKDVNRHLTQKETMNSNKHMKRHSALFVIRKKKVFTSMRHYFASTCRQKVMSLTIPSVGRDVE